MAGRQGDSENRDVLDQFISILEEGIAFYKEAMVLIEDPLVAEVFQRMVVNRRQAIATLQQAGAARPEDEAQTSAPVVNLNLAKARALIQSPERAYIGELARFEKATLEALENCYEAMSDVETKALFADLRFTFRETAEAMEALKVSRKA